MEVFPKSVPDHHHLNFLVDFAVPETIIFNISLISTRSSPPTAGQSASQTRPGSSGDSHFHAQNGSSSFRSPAFSSSKRLKLVPEPRIFTLDRELIPEPGPIFHFAVAHVWLWHDIWSKTPIPDRNSKTGLLFVCAQSAKYALHCAQYAKCLDWTADEIILAIANEKKIPGCFVSRCYVGSGGGNTVSGLAAARAGNVHSLRPASPVIIELAFARVSGYRRSCKYQYHIFSVWL